MSEEEKMHIYRHASSELERLMRHNPARPMGSPFEIFDGRKRKKKEGEKPLKRCSNKETLQVSASETRRGKVTSTAPINERYSGRRIALIGKLAPDHIVMLRACYLPESNQQWEYQQKANVMIQRLYIEEGKTRLRSPMRELLPRMAALKLESLRSPALAIGMRNKTWEYFDITPDNWRQTYVKKWRRVCELVDKVHFDAVMAFDRLENFR